MNLTEPGNQKADAVDLEALSDALAARRADLRTAAVVRRAFLSSGALTLRKYLALEEAQSPVLTKQWPWEDAAAMAQAFCTAWEILLPQWKIPEPDKLGEGILHMSREVHRGFSTLMAMRMPVLPGSSVQPMRDDGIGWVPRLMAQALLANIPDPIDIPLDRLFVLTAASRFNEGAECVGTDYKDRELDLVPVESEPEENHGNKEVGQQDAPEHDQGKFDGVSDHG